MYGLEEVQVRFEFDLEEVLVKFDLEVSIRGLRLGEGQRASLLARGKYELVHGSNAFRLLQGFA